MNPIEILKRNSYRCVVDALVAAGRIYETKSSRGTRGASFVTSDGRVKVLCLSGVLCRDPNCRFHHLHEDVDKMSKNHRLCWSNERCSRTDCKFRHTIRCRELMDLIDSCFVHCPWIYHIFVGQLMAAIGSAELDREEEIQYLAALDDFNKDIVTKALAKGDMAQVRMLEGQGHNVRRFLF